jgi:hypothetical protein
MKPALDPNLVEEDRGGVDHNGAIIYDHQLALAWHR